MAKTIQEINQKIRQGKAVVYTAQEIIGVVKKKGLQQAAVEVDVVSTGSFGPMCSSGPPMTAKLGRAFGDHPFYPLGSDNLWYGAGITIFFPGHGSRRSPNAADGPECRNPGGEYGQPCSCHGWLVPC